MSARGEALLALLADGARHSGSELAEQLGVTRSAVWKHVAELRRLGIDVVSLERRGYSLARPVELLDAERIRAASRHAAHPWLAGLELRFETGSTNAELVAAGPSPPGRPRVLIAERQTRGRGRRGRAWLAPFGSGLTLSIGWSYAEIPPDIPALSLGLGVAVVEALQQAGAHDVQVKWPNDLVARGGKLGGLLVELRSEAGGPAYVVAGLGLNLDLPPAQRAALAGPSALPAVDLAELLGGSPPPRNELAARVIDALLDALDLFGRTGFAGFAERWGAADSLRDRPVSVLQGDESLEGVARGADRDGALRVEVDGVVRRFVSGEVSLRPGAERSAA